MENNETLDRIQREIQEALEREEELRQKYNKINNNVEDSSPEFSSSSSPEPVKIISPTKNPEPVSQNGRMFTSNKKGVMQKFIKMRGKLNLATIKPQKDRQSTWSEDVFIPAKVTTENGKPIRNGFVSAEEKMKKELIEFQMREAELRLERRKSQPDLMAALQREEENNLVPAKSVTNLYMNEDFDDGSSGSNSVKRAQSLADLIGASDEEWECKGTHSLIKQFERMRSQD